MERLGTPSARSSLAFLAKYPAIASLRNPPTKTYRKPLALAIAGSGIQSVPRPAASYQPRNSPGENAGAGAVASAAWARVASPARMAACLAITRGPPGAGRATTHPQSPYPDRPRPRHPGAGSRPLTRGFAPISLALVWPPRTDRGLPMPPPERLTATAAGLLVVDVQEKLLARMPGRAARGGECRAPGRGGEGPGHLVLGDRAISEGTRADGRPDRRPHPRSPGQDDLPRPRRPRDPRKAPIRGDPPRHDRRHRGPHLRRPDRHRAAPPGIRRPGRRRRRRLAF